jgi:hypothetical protein
MFPATVPCCQKASKGMKSGLIGEEEALVEEMEAERRRGRI